MWLGTTSMMLLIAGIDAASPIRRYPAGGAAGTVNFANLPEARFGSI